MQEFDLSGLLDIMLYELDMQDPQKKWLLNLPKEDGTVLQHSCFIIELSDILYDLILQHIGLFIHLLSKNIFGASKFGDLWTEY